MPALCTVIVLGFLMIRSGDEWGIPFLAACWLATIGRLLEPAAVVFAGHVLQ